MICLVFFLGWLFGRWQEKLDARLRALHRTVPLPMPTEAVHPLERFSSIPRPIPPDPPHPAETRYLN